MNEPAIDTKTRDINSPSSLHVTVGTNCPQGGGSAHGGRTVFRLENRSRTDWHVSVNAERVAVYPDSIEVHLGGDSEAQSFAQALRWAASVLDCQVVLNRLYGDDATSPQQL